MLALGVVGLSPATAFGAGTSAPSAMPSYLALGDSVTFGYRESNTTPPPDYYIASTFHGYPQFVGQTLGYSVANAACPGETSASLIVEEVQSNGCENSPGGGPGYRTAYPLHVKYGGTQLQYAVAYLKSHPDTQVVSLMIGANDAFLCEETTADHCASELSAVLTQIKDNVSVILSTIRADAGYQGKIVILDYYSLDYANPLDTAESLALDHALNSGAKPFDVVVANGFGAFKTASASSGGDPCQAGLLTQLNSGGCGVHPSLAGQTVLAKAVEQAIKG